MMMKTRIEAAAHQALSWVQQSAQRRNLQAADNQLACGENLLHHCETVIKKLRMQTGGLQLVIFKIGITHECSRRFQLYKEKGWDRMVVMYQSDELGAIEMLEAALISQHCHLKQCRNVLRGGEGMRDNMFQPKFEPPYFCYCVSARADRPRWVV